MRVKNFKRLLISIPKCIELNSKSNFGLGFKSTPRTQTQYILFWGVKCLPFLKSFFRNNFFTKIQMENNTKNVLKIFHLDFYTIL
jgi:hypothetical protein